MNSLDLFVYRQSKMNPWGYEQYPQDSEDCINIYKNLLKRAKRINRKYRDDEIIIIQRKGNLLYYSYNRQLSKGGWIGLGIRRSAICKNYLTLYELFRCLLKGLDSQELLITHKKNGNFKFKGEGIYCGDETLLGNLSAFFLSQEHNINRAFSDAIKININETISDIPLNGKRLTTSNSNEFVENIKNGFPLVYILPEQKNSLKDNHLTINWDNIIAYSIIGCFILLVLFNYIAPWFIPSTWPKIALILTGFGIYFVIDAIDENSKRKHKGILGWLGAIAILFSTVLTIYGLYNHFSPDTEEKSKPILSVELEDVVHPKDEQGAKPVTNTSFKEENHKIKEQNVSVNKEKTTELQTQKKSERYQENSDYEKAKYYCSNKKFKEAKMYAERALSHTNDKHHREELNRIIETCNAWETPGE